MKTSKLLFYASLCLTLFVQTSCIVEKKEDNTTEEVKKVKVKVLPVNSQDVEQLAEFTATVEPNISNNIAPQNPVRIDQLYAEVGDHVKAGQLLAKTDETSLKQAKIQLDNQEMEFNRID